MNQHHRIEEAIRLCQEQRVLLNQQEELLMQELDALNEADLKARTVKVPLHLVMQLVSMRPMAMSTREKCVGYRGGCMGKDCGGCVGMDCTRKPNAGCCIFVVDIKPLPRLVVCNTCSWVENVWLDVCMREWIHLDASDIAIDPLRFPKIDWPLAMVEFRTQFNSAD
jgi:hypothetical protein